MRRERRKSPHFITNVKASQKKYKHITDRIFHFQLNFLNCTIRFSFIEPVNRNSLMKSAPLLQSEHQLVTQGLDSREQCEACDDEQIFDHPTEANSSFFHVFFILLNSAIGSGTLLVPYCYTSGIGTALIISAIFAFVS